MRENLPPNAVREQPVAGGDVENTPARREREPGGVGHATIGEAHPRRLLARRRRVERVALVAVRRDAGAAPAAHRQRAAAGRPQQSEALRRRPADRERPLPCVDGELLWVRRGRTALAAASGRRLVGPLVKAAAERQRAALADPPPADAQTDPARR